MITINDLKALTEKLQRDAEAKNEQKITTECGHLFTMGEVYGMQTAIYNLWKFINEQQTKITN